MNKIVVSTIGTSLLTNQIAHNHAAEKEWYSKLRDVANLSLSETPDEVKAIIQTLVIAPSKSYLPPPSAKFARPAPNSTACTGYTTMT